MQNLFLLNHTSLNQRILYVLVLLFFISGIGGYASSLPPLPKTVKRIVFLGNSITYSGKYIKDIAAFYSINYPQQNIEFINVGLSSETVSGLSEEGHADGKFPRPDLHERLERVLAATKPDLVFACYGMNDGIYLPWDKERFQRFKDGIHWLHEELIKAKVKIVHLTPPVYDETRGGKVGYDDVLERYAAWLLEKRETHSWEVVDIHGPMKAFLAHQRQSDPSFALAVDGVHPGDKGHWIMAKEVLLYLGERKVIDAGDINAALPMAPYVDEVLKVVSERQDMMRDAWLTATGHKRPGVRPGLTFEEALPKAKEMEDKIRELVKRK